MDVDWHETKIIYTDGVHLMITRREPIALLHVFAEEIGLRRGWFQDHDKHPHYDLTTERKFLKAVDFGANVICVRRLILLCNRDGYNDNGLWNDIRDEPEFKEDHPDAR